MDSAIKGGNSELKCPYCGSEFVGNPLYCPSCKQPLSRAAAPEPRVRESKAAVHQEVRTRPQRWLIAVASLMCAVLICFGIYKMYFWADNYRINRLYTRGEFTPTINEITMEDGREGHTIVFYGEDGDQVFLPEMQKSLSISGGTARITIADSDWFTEDVKEIESANVCLSPVLITEKGIRTQLPDINIEVAVPDSPLEVISPADDNLSIVTSRYELEFKVVPGSHVTVNGEDVTDIVDRNGLLEQNVNVYPVGDNIYTIVVNTPYHHETRREVKIHRQEFDITVEVDPSVSTVSQTESTTIKGVIEEGASLSVETTYIPQSLIVDPVTGQFSFIAKLTNFGNNTVRFRVTKEGKQDAVVTLGVEYFPTLGDYTKNAWAMNYDQLRNLYEQWSGQVFSCKGVIIDIYESNGASYLVMDVGSDGIEQLVILENKSAVAEPYIGQKCNAYADVNGRSMYKDQYYPMLTARYIYYTKE